MCSINPLVAISNAIFHPLHMPIIRVLGKKGQKRDMELDESLYLMRTLRVRDKKVREQLNFLKIMNINHDKEGILQTALQAPLPPGKHLKPHLPSL